MAVVTLAAIDDDPWQAPSLGEPTRPAGRKTISDRLLSRSALSQLPTPAPLIDRTIDLRTVAVLAGYWGTCKSFTAQDWAACIATGKAWQGRRVEQGAVLYVAAEGAFGIGQRLDAWEYAWHCDIPPDEFAVYPEPVNLLSEAAVVELTQAAAGRRLVIVDTLARCMPGGDENSARDMGIAVGALYRVRRATENGSVLALHHTGKDKTTIRGSSALEAGVDVIYTTDGTPDALTLERTKRKDGPVHDRLDLRLETHLDSAVIVSANPRTDTGTEDKLLSAFLSTFGDTGGTRAELRTVAEMPPASFARGLNALIRKGLLVNTGTDKRPFYKSPEQP